MTINITKWCYASVGDVVCFDKDYMHERTTLDVENVDLYLILDIKRRDIHMHANLLQLHTGVYHHDFIVSIHTVMKRLNLT